MTNTPNFNRRSLGSDTLEVATFPKSSTSMTDIQSSRVNEMSNNCNILSSKSTGDIASNDVTTNDKTIYTYIGMSEPDGTARKQHIYENQSIIDAQNKTKCTFDSKKHEEM